MLYLGVLMLIPLIRGLQLSLTDAKLMAPNRGNPIGLSNYSKLLTSDQFWNSLVTTIVYTAATVILSLVLGLLIAILLNRPFPGRSVVRSIVTFPYAMPTVAAALIFVWMLNPSMGVANRGLAVLGIGQVNWLIDPKYGLLSVVVATVWKVTPFVMLVLLSSLQSVPEELFEACRIDGASSLSAIRAIVIPHLAPAIRLVALLMTIWSIRRFEIIYLLTGGGPLDTTNVLVVNIYRKAFQDHDLGVAAAIGMLGLGLSLSITAVFLVVERREARKEG